MAHALGPDRGPVPRGTMTSGSRRMLRGMQVWDESDEVTSPRTTKAARDLLYSLQYESSSKEAAFNRYLFTASRIARQLKQYGKYVRRRACVCASPVVAHVCGVDLWQQVAHVEGRG